MPHLLPLLIRGINNLSDARYCAGMGADKLTFILDPAIPGFLDTKAVKELAGWVAGVELIGEFDQLNASEINAIAAECGLDAVLLRQPRSAAELAEIAPPAYIELAIGSVSIAGYLPHSSAGLLIEITEPLTTKTMEKLHAISQQHPLWLGPGLQPDLARDLATQLLLAGLVFPSGDEVKPGLRDFDQLEAVFEALETE
ncbi:hypothetical protein [Hymenobacter sp. B1770]|uniref:hypothetical protein n=1 Tax=Hymenobacter sp. B1770 TaxID=1718788 RepID=UPI003CEC8FC7